MSATPKPGVQYSLRRRLLTGMTVGFLAILTLISVGLWSYARNAANRTYDLLLSGSAISILERITPAPSGVIIDLPPSALEILGLAESDRVFYRIFNDKGETYTGDPALPLPPTVTPGKPVFFDAPYSGEIVRFTARGRPLLGPAEPEWMIVQIGQTRQARDELQFDLISKGLIGLTGIAVIGLIFVRFGIGRALQPLAGIEADIRQREPTDLAPLKVLPPREVESLIGSINEFMRRLDISKDHAQAFIADVAHQMRTSLTILQGQIQLAVEQKNSNSMMLRLTQAAEQSKRTIRLTNQLLSHAMVVHRADNQLSEEVDLASLVEGLLEEVMRDPATQQVEFEFSMKGLDKCNANVTGDPVTLREAIRNILDNAVKHGSPANSVEISLEWCQIGSASAIRVVIEDAGPGIPDEERQNVFKRFYSLKEDGAGSGIGLSIVKTVTDSHGGVLNLSRSRLGGLCVQLDLPVERIQ